MSVKFYGVSVGPGDPELITLKAKRIIEECEVIAAPRTGGNRSLSLDIVKGVIDISQKRIIYLDFPMKKSGNEQVHLKAAGHICAELKKGKSVCMPNIGDVSIYSTFSYIQELVEDRGFECEAVAGVPSFCAAAARLGTSLTVRNKPIIIIPAGYGLNLLDFEGTKVLMKSGSELGGVIFELKRRGLKAEVVQSCGLENENVTDLDGTIYKDYFTTIVIKD